MLSTDYLLQLALVVWLAICAFLDWRNREVPNALTLPAFAVGVIYALSIGGGRLLLVSITLVVFAAARAFVKGIGAADIKVLVALAALWTEAYFAALAVMTLWSVIQIMRGRRREEFAGIPPMAIGAMLVLWIEVIKVRALL